MNCIKIISLKIFRFTDSVNSKILTAEKKHTQKSNIYIYIYIPDSQFFYQMREEESKKRAMFRSADSGDPLGLKSQDREMLLTH